jgi:hypothetical protein
MWSVTGTEGETSSQVSLHVGTETIKNRSINGLLVGYVLCRELLLLEFVLKEITLSSLCPLLLFSRLEVAIVKLGNINLAHINLCGCGNDVCLVNATQWNSIDLEWSGHHEKTRWKLSQEDNALSLEASSQKDENSSWSDGSAKLCLSTGKSAWQWLGYVLSWVELWCLGLNLGLDSLWVSWELTTILLLNGPQSTAMK